MPSRISWIFQQTTAPQVADSATQRTAGWSEGFWAAGDIGSTNAAIRGIAQLRALMLPSTGAVVGFRIGLYTISGNKLLPRGTSAGKFLFPGNPAALPDDPRAALEFSAKGDGVPNSSKFTLRGIPDGIIQGGEYAPTPGFKGLVTRYKNALLDSALGFIGRDLSQPTARVLTIAAGVVTLDGPIGGVANTSYLRMNRVRDDNDKPVKGVFRITAINGNAYTVTGLGATTLTQASGTARIDALDFMDFGEIDVNQSTVKKVGRPSRQYRGRASKA